MQHRAHILSQCALMNIAAIPTTFAPSLLPDLALIRLQGADAAAFIHNQLSHDFLLLKPEEARLAVWCTPKGRALVSFYGFKPQADTVYLLLAADSVEFIVKRLKMFVLRSKCTVEDVSAQWRISGHIEKIESGAKALARLAGSWLTPAATCFAVSPMACPQVRVVGASGSSGVGGAAVGSYCGA